ncbi:transposase [Cellvibrio sp.]|uniref:transposase n=1 Tax=Cellvibrio sp. TaxID=1965322 RepID=UPI00374F4B28
MQPFCATEGRPAIPSRFMIGLYILKSIYQLSEEEVYECWVENLYYQYFCGEEFSIQRSTITH